MAYSTIFKNFARLGKNSVDDTAKAAYKTTSSLGSKIPVNAAIDTSKAIKLGARDTARIAEQSSKPLVNRQIRNGLVNAGLIGGGLVAAGGVAKLSGLGLGSGVSDIGSGIGSFVDDVTARVTPENEVASYEAQTNYLDSLTGLTNAGGSASDELQPKTMGSGSAISTVLLLAGVGFVGYSAYKVYKNKKSGKKTSKQK